MSRRWKNSRHKRDAALILFLGAVCWLAVVGAFAIVYWVILHA